MSQLKKAEQFADDYRKNPTKGTARKLLLARWFSRDTEGAKLMQRLSLVPYCCLPMDHPDRKLTVEQYYVLGNWSCEKP